nr:sporulation protein [Rummeliibacillus sp. POC4]
MSLLHKALASLGIGAATVDTKLEKADYTGGEVIHGEVQIRGGNVDQQIDERASCKLIEKYAG